MKGPNPNLDFFDFPIFFKQVRGNERRNYGWEYLKTMLE